MRHPLPGDTLNCRVLPVISVSLLPPPRGAASSETDPPPQLAANAVLFLCGNVAGAYHKALMERALRATFREALSSLHSRRRLDTEKKHQVLRARRPSGAGARTEELFGSRNRAPETE